MIFISKRRFEAEVSKRIKEAVCKHEENYWRAEREREQHRYVKALEKRLIELEKKNGIDHPSHHEGVCADW